MMTSKDIHWRPLPSPLDGIEHPQLEVLEAECHRRLVCLVSSWLNDDCLKVFSVTFERPAAILAVEEALYSMAEQAQGSTYDGARYLKEANSSPLLSTLQDVTYSNDKWRHFLLVGGSTCLEVVAPNAPSVVQQLNYDRARASLATA